MRLRLLDYREGVMDKRLKKKKLKENFLNHFTKDDYKFYCKYPRLFTLYKMENAFTLSDINRWFNKFICENAIFENTIRALYFRVNEDKTLELENDYPNLVKYNFKYLMENIQDIIWKEIFPRRIDYNLRKYLKLI